MGSFDHRCGLEQGRHAAEVLHNLLKFEGYHTVEVVSSQGMFEFDMGKVPQSAPQVFAIDPLKTAEKKMSKLIVDFQLTSYLHSDA